MRKSTSIQRLVFPLLTALMILTLVEVGVRAIFAIRLGPRVLLYGTPFQRKQMEPEVVGGTDASSQLEAKDFLSAMSWRKWLKIQTATVLSDEKAGYTKYFPNEKKFDLDLDTGTRFRVAINQRGFRGRDFEERKAPGVIRVVSLGASSTFGYFSTDDQTYPVFLEEILNEEGGSIASFEVINLGIPHFRSDNIRALFFAEALSLGPDVVTLYAGSNDVHKIGKASDRFLITRVAVRFSMLVGLIDSLIENRRSQAGFPRMASDASEVFIKNVSRIYRECKERGVLFVVANQQKNSQSIDREELKGVTYAEEAEGIRAKVARSQTLTPNERRMLAHAVLMEDLESWAEANEVPFVDVIGRLDQERDVLVSWVHLSPKGNQMVARAFADEILENISH